MEDEDRQRGGNAGQVAAHVACGNGGHLEPNDALRAAQLHLVFDPRLQKVAVRLRRQPVPVVLELHHDCAHLFLPVGICASGRHAAEHDGQSRVPD